jgi:heme ABC exporter ATP-binding subunit CcmA
MSCGTAPQDEIDSLDAASAGAIEVRRLCFERVGRLILDGVNLRIEPGQLVGVMGANGAGKTTLLRCLAGLAQPTSGHVRWFGQSPRESIGLRRAIGMVAHQDWVYAEFTPRENLMFAARMQNVANAAARVDQLLSEAGLLAYANMATGELSHGMRRRLSICRTLVPAPRIMLLDEPFYGIDDEGQQWLVRLVRQDPSVAVCMTTHHDALIRHMADRLLELRGGKLHDRADSIDGRVQPAWIQEHVA